MLRVKILAEKPITNSKRNQKKPNEIPYRNVLFHAESALSIAIPSLQPRIPIFIVDDEVFDQIRNCKPQIDEEVPTEALACYIHDFDTSILNRYYPTKLCPKFKCNSILMCINRIMTVAERLHYSDEHLMSIVLIHEFGHAYMDILEPNCYHYDNPIYKNNEESWANVFTLSTIESYLNRIDFCIKGGADTLLDKAKDFINKHQPKEYRLGGFLWENNVRDFDLWAYHKHEMGIWTSWDSFAMGKFSANDNTGLLLQWNSIVNALRK
ncbi:MAG: hypothetical protein MJZ24_05545 [Paludibacteraceae bacterium]|nr:hypothetical protein [Paludibacteraceae bacterium]